MDMIEERTGQPGVSVFKQAVNNAKPTLEVKSRRVGGASLQVPVEVRPDRRTALAMRWLISFSRARTEKTMAERLAAELILASQGRRQHHQEEGRHAPDGRGQPGVRALSLVAMDSMVTAAGAPNWVPAASSMGYPLQTVPDRSRLRRAGAPIVVPSPSLSAIVRTDDRSV